jgi:hypothetical protein
LFLRARTGFARVKPAGNGGSSDVRGVTTVAFEGIEARAVDVQVQIGPGLPAFTIVGLADKAVAESRERVRGALNAIGLALRPSASPSILPPPIFRKKAVITTCRSRSG